MAAQVLTAEQEAQLDECKATLSKAKIQLMARGDSAFFCTLAFSFVYIWDWVIGTANTNGRNIRLSPAFWMSLDADERLFLLLHEVLHCAFMHMIRLPAGWCHDRFNIACDHVINLMLIKRGFKMPACGYADPQYEGMSAEEVYKLLPDNPGKPMFDDLVDPTEDGDSKPGDQAGIEEARVVLQREIEDILIRAQMQSQMAEDAPGTIPGEIEIFLNKLLEPKLPWNRILQKYLQNFAKNDYTFKKPNRRFFPQHIMPSLHSEALIDMAVAIDTSGSVSDEDFLRFISETHTILRMMKPKKMTLVQFDSELKSVDSVGSIQELMRVKFTGRGGTEIGPVLDWAAVNKPQLILVFSDGEFDMPDVYTRLNFLWIIHNDPQWTAPFGKVIHYTLEH